MSIGAIDLFTQLVRNDFGYFKKIQSAADLMTRDPDSLDLDKTLADAIELFRRGGFHHAPVMSPEDGSVVGIISDRDVLRYYPYHLGTLSESDDDPRALSASVSQIMNRDVVHVSSSSTPTEIVTAMLTHHIDSVLVYDDPNNIEGIITQRDFVRILLLYHQICTRNTELKRLRIVDLDLENGIPVDLIFSRGAQTARDVMTKEVVSLPGKATVEDAIDAMQTHEIRHLPIVDENQRLTGILSDREILKWLPVPGNQSAGRSVKPLFRERLFASDDPASLRQECRKIMVKDPISVHSCTLLSEIMTNFLDGTASGVTVVDDDQQILGILTTTDVLRVCRVIFQLSSARIDAGN